MSWPQYLFFVGAAISSMLAGGATVRWILKPDLVSLCTNNNDCMYNVLFQTIPELPLDEQHSKSKVD